VILFPDAKISSYDYANMKYVVAAANTVYVMENLQTKETSFVHLGVQSLIHSRQNVQYSNTTYEDGFHPGTIDLKLNSRGITH
jgi:hypothetical protein